MSVSINSNMLSLNVQNTYNKNVVGLQNSMNALSTGQRINYGGDDPSGLALSERLRTRIDSLDQANKNIQNDSAILKIADGALSNLSDIVSKIRSEVVRASDSNVTDEDRKTIANSIDELRKQYNKIISEDTKYNGHTFYAPATVAADSDTEKAGVTADANGYLTKKFTVHWGADKGNKWDIDFGAIDTETIGLTAAATSTIITNSAKLPDDIDDILDTVDTAAQKLYQEQAKLGTYEQRLGYLSDNAVAEKTALTEIESNIRDTDVAQGMTDFMRYNIRTQTSQYMLAQANQVPAMVLQLLQP